MDFKGVLSRMTTQMMWPFLNLLSNKIPTETILLLFKMLQLQLSLHLEEGVYSTLSTTQGSGTFTMGHLILRSKGWGIYSFFVFMFIKSDEEDKNPRK
jgi:hypothetical protein